MNIIKLQKISGFGVLGKIYTLVIIIAHLHIPDKYNFEADKNFRKFEDGTEGQLNSKIRKAVCDTIGTPEIDLFACGINKKSEKSVSWKPEPADFAVDAISINWSHHFMYLFLPFNLLKKVIKKICQDQATGILVFSAWSTQPWYPQELELSREVSIKIRPNLTNLILPQDKAAVPPLAEKFTLHITKFNYG